MNLITIITNGILSSSDCQLIDLSTSCGLDKEEKVYRGTKQFDLPTPSTEVGKSIDSVDGSRDKTESSDAVSDEVFNGPKSERSKRDSGNSKADDYDEDDWVLLDCCFGIPLFDRQVNETVCRRMESHGLCHESRLVGMFSWHEIEIK